MWACVRLYRQGPGLLWTYGEEVLMTLKDPRRNPRLPLYRPVDNRGRESPWSRGSLEVQGISMDEAIEFFDTPDSGIVDQEDPHESIEDPG